MADRQALTLRLEPDMYDRLKAQAEREDRTLTSQIVHYVRRGLAQDERAREEGEQS